MKIAHREIGPDHPPLLVAEIGLSHCGSLDTCKETMRILAERGIEAVKLQTHIAEEEMQPGHRWWDTIVRCSLTEHEERAAFRYAESLGLICFSTPFSLAAVERLERIGTPAYKIGSGEASHFALIDAVRATGKPLLVSNGMMNLTARTLDPYLDDGTPIDVVLMYCVSEYPTPPSRWGLGRLAEGFADRAREIARRDSIADYWNLVGYSDHTRSPAAVHAAVALGASVVEVHVGLPWVTDRPDACVEWSPEAAAALNKSMRDIWLGMRPVENRGADVARFCQRDASGRRIAT